MIDIGYMSKAGVNIVQNFTPDHDLAVKAARLPRGAFSTMDSPYLSLISLVRGWPPQNGAARGFDGAMALIGAVAKSPRPLVLDLTMEQSARGTTSLFIRSS